MIEIEKLTMCYGELRAVDELDLRVEPGEFFAFLGPNGAGKTTTIKTLTGLLKPTSGCSRISGHDIQVDPVAAKSVMGFVPDVAVFYDKLTPREFMEFIGDIFGVEQARGRENTASLFEKLDLERYAHQQIETLSHGTRQRLAISAALMHDPKVFIIDEPMVGLDPLARPSSQTGAQGAQPQRHDDLHVDALAQYRRGTRGQNRHHRSGKARRPRDGR